jgi:hypothetical protein
MVLFIEKTWLFWWVLALVAIVRSYSPPSAGPKERDSDSTGIRKARGPFEKHSVRVQPSTD